MQFVDHATEWSDALIKEEAGINLLKKGLYLAAIHPVKRPDIILHGVIETESYGEPEITIPESAPLMRLLKKDLDKVRSGLNAGSRSTIYSIAPMIARHNLMSLGTNLSNPEFEKFNAVVNKKDLPAGFRYSFSFSRDIHDETIPLSASSHIRGVKGKWNDWFIDLQDLIKSRSFMDTYAKRVNQRVGVFTIEPLDFQQWRQRSLAYLEMANRSVVIDGEIVQP